MADLKFKVGDSVYLTSALPIVSVLDAGERRRYEVRFPFNFLTYVDGDWIAKAPGVREPGPDPRVDWDRVLAQLDAMVKRNEAAKPRPTAGVDSVLAEVTKAIEAERVRLRKSKMPDVWKVAAVDSVNRVERRIRKRLASGGGGRS